MNTTQTNQLGQRPMKHTSGPWHVKHDWGTSVCNSVGQCVADTDANVHIDDQTKAANAELIALAPTLLAQRDALLAALQHCIAYLERDADDDQERKDHAEARAAIALAGGGL